ncbi:MAG: Beta-lactamase [Pseudomonadota bacterium]|jgi:beta-lactamase class A|nr:classA [uncultured bacterium]MDQ5904497.1 Beta-lactamase [Pseudomonadota bacterium]AMP48067.1 classA [uncultured bacterium]AMP48574.1 classA [uncultured bacterium]AMP48590.1 classA [uncultured bacterium]
MDTGILDLAVTQEETTLQARVGVAVIDTDSGLTWQHRGDERFPLNSTHKAFSCAAVLAQADRHKLNLEQAIPIERTALVTYSPVTERVPPGGTLTLRELCRAAVSISDNTAANLALDAIGGARTFTAFMRSIGDDKTRLDRREPELNEATPGDARDTTTPIAAARSLQTLLLDGVLSAPARNELTQWMLGDQVADALLRAGLPRDWQIADKSGAGGHGSRSIIAVVWPPKRSAVIVAIYITQTAASMSASNQAVSRIGSALAKALQ